MRYNLYEIVKAISDECRKEGWDLFDCDTRRSPRCSVLEIQRVDEPDWEGPPMFECDDDAIKHVLARAMAGSVPHQRALLIHGSPAHAEPSYLP